MQVYIVSSFCDDSQIQQYEGVYATKILAEARCQEVIQQAQQDLEQNGLKHQIYYESDAEGNLVQRFHQRPENYLNVIHTNDTFTLEYTGYRVWIEEHPVVGLTVTKSARNR